MSELVPGLTIVKSWKCPCGATAYFCRAASGGAALVHPVPDDCAAFRQLLAEVCAELGAPNHSEVRHAEGCTCAQHDEVPRA
jgi:hypothetical protein